MKTIWACTVSINVVILLKFDAHGQKNLLVLKVDLCNYCILKFHSTVDSDFKGI